MYQPSRENFLLKRIVNGQILINIKIVRMLDSDMSFLNYLPEIGICIAYVNSSVLREMNLRSPNVYVYPPKPGEKLSTFFTDSGSRNLSLFFDSKRENESKTMKFHLRETERTIRTICEDPYTGEGKIVDKCIEAPDYWFDENGILALNTDAIIKAELYPIKR